jgi:hypothetical protein
MSEPDRRVPPPTSGAGSPAPRDGTSAREPAPVPRDEEGRAPAPDPPDPTAASAAPPGSLGPPAGAPAPVEPAPAPAATGSVAAAPPKPGTPAPEASSTPATAGPTIAPASTEAPRRESPSPVEVAAPTASAHRRERRDGPGLLAERPEVAIEVPRHRLAAQSRRAFILYVAGVAATAVGAWWLLPDRTKGRLLPGPARGWLDTLAGRVGLSRERRERALGRALTFDDDVAEALYSKDRRVRTYDRTQATDLRNNYDGQTPGPEYLPGWALRVSGLASGRTERLAIDELLRRFPRHEQVTRLVCVEGWSAIAWWGGIRFADFLAAFPPAAGARWAAIRSAVNLDGAGRPDPYYVSIDLGTARHPQTLLATHLGGQPLTLAHGAPMRLLVPMKLGLKNIKAMTEIAYTAAEPPDYWNERGYSKYDGL